jgi:hypothetical protein
MTFNSGTFFIVGTAIAIAGVGLYIWDTRGSAALSSVPSLFGSSNTPSYDSSRDSFMSTDSAIHGGKTKKHKKKQNRKTKRH